MMKPAHYAISAFLMLSFASTAALAYSGSECEVNDCSKPGPAKSKSAPSKSQPQTKAEVKAAAKDEAKTQAKTKLMDSAPSALKDAAGFFK